MFKGLTLRATSFLLLLLLLLAGGVVVVGGGYINNGTGEIKDTWQTFDAERSEITRLESSLRASLGYGGMIHAFKNYVLRKSPALKRKALGHLNAARAILDQYGNLSLSNAERAAVEDIAATLNKYEGAIDRAALMINAGEKSKSIDGEVKVDDTPAFRGLEMLHEGSAIRVARHGLTTSKALLLGELRGVLGYGGMIHHFKNYILRGTEGHVKTAIIKLEQGRALLERYRMLDPTPGERSALDAIEDTLSAYESGLRLKSNELAHASSPEKLDSMVRVDDHKALRALKILDSEIAEYIQVRSLVMDANITRIEIVSKGLLWIALVVLGGTAVVSFILIRGQFIAPLQMISLSMNELCSGNLNIEIAHTDAINEVGDMARAVQMFRENLIRVKDVEAQLIHSNERLNTQLASVRDLKERSDEQAAKAIDLAEGLALAREEAERATHKAEADENRTRTIMDTVMDAIITIDDKGVIETFSPAAQAMFGYSEDEALGRNVNILMPVPQSAKHDEYIAAYHSGNGAGRIGKRIEQSAIRLDGTTFPVEVSIRMTKICGATKFIGVLRDITDRKRAEEELNHHRENLEELVRQRTTEVEAKTQQLETALAGEKRYSALQKKFIALFSHELRTPLTIIDGTAQRLVRAKENLSREQIKDRGEKIRDAVGRMINLMDTTLYVSHLDTSKTKAHFKPFAFKEFFRKLCDEQGARSLAHDIRTDLDELPEHLTGDVKLLEHVFKNLLSNAVKYAPHSPLVEVSGKTEGGNTMISIRDHGVGISQEDLPFMFERYFRAKTSDGIQGMGINLSISKDFIETHGGTITLDSVKGQGTTFTVQLPIDAEGREVGSGRAYSEPSLEN